MRWNLICKYNVEIISIPENRGMNIEPQYNNAHIFTLDHNRTGDFISNRKIPYFPIFIYFLLSSDKLK